MNEIISEKTMIPISLVIITLGGGVWLTNLHYQTSANAIELQKITLRQERYSEDLSDIKGKLQEIAGELKRIKR